MAKRESQGLQIALIVFVLVTVVFMVLTVLFWKKADNAIADLAETNRQLQSAQTNFRTANEDLASLKEILGYAPTVSVGDIQSAFETDMLAYAQALPNDQRNYRSLPKHLHDALVGRNATLVQANDQIQQLRAEMESRLKQEAANLDKALKEKADAEQTLAQERAKFNSDRAKLSQERESEQRSYRERLAKIQTEIEQKEQIASNSERDLGRLQEKHRLVLELLEEIQSETLEVPDGKIVAANQHARLVTINLGEADAVRPQMTFEVYDIDENNLARASSKGKIEVVRVGPRTSEARIRDDQLSNPIVAGDAVHSRVWERGSPVRFALAGFIDVDQDGRSDRELIRDLIKLNGGAVDAEVSDSGERTGEVSIHTRYLVLGDPPEDGEVLSEYTKIVAEAETNGVEKKSVSEILGYIGYDRQRGTIPLGASARAVDFKPRPYEGVFRRSGGGKVSELYKVEPPPFRSRR